MTNKIDSASSASLNPAFIPFLVLPFLLRYPCFHTFSQRTLFIYFILRFIDLGITHIPLLPCNILNTLAQP